MSWAGSSINAAKTLKQNREARLSKRKPKERFPVHLQDSEIELNYNTTPLTEEEKSIIQKRLKKQRLKSRFLLSIIACIIAVILYVIITN